MREIRYLQRKARKKDDIKTMKMERLLLTVIVMITIVIRIRIILTAIIIIIMIIRRKIFLSK